MERVGDPPYSEQGSDFRHSRSQIPDFLRSTATNVSNFALGIASNDHTLADRWKFFTLHLLFFESAPPFIRLLEGNL